MPFLLLLAVTSATPALAARPQDRDDNQQHKHHDGDKKPERDARPDRGGRPGGARPMPASQATPLRSGGGAWNGGRHDAGRSDAGWHHDRDPGNTGVPPGTPNSGRPDRGPGGWNNGRPDRGPGTPPPPHDWNNGRPDHSSGGWNGRPDRPGDGRDGRPGRDDHRSPQAGGGWDHGRPQGGWDRGWRNDRRYDWQRFRTFNRDRFRAGIYYAPGGYSYRPWYAGSRVSPYFFERRYWLEDPAFFNLPYPPPGCAWVRYFNDVALIELDDGAVLDVIPNFFF